MNDIPINADAELSYKIFNEMLAHVHSHNGDSGNLMSLMGMLGTHFVMHCARDKMAGVDHLADMIRANVTVGMELTRLMPNGPTLQ